MNVYGLLAPELPMAPVRAQWSSVRQSHLLISVKPKNLSSMCQ